MSRPDTADSLWSSARSLRWRILKMGVEGFSGNSSDYAQALQYLSALAAVLDRHKQTTRNVDPAIERSQSS